MTVMQGMLLSLQPAASPDTADRTSLEYTPHLQLSICSPPAQLHLFWVREHLKQETPLKRVLFFVLSLHFFHEFGLSLSPKLVVFRSSQCSACQSRSACGYSRWCASRWLTGKKVAQGIFYLLIQIKKFLFIFFLGGSASTIYFFFHNG